MNESLHVVAQVQAVEKVVPVAPLVEVPQVMVSHVGNHFYIGGDAEIETVAPQYEAPQTLQDEPVTATDVSHVPSYSMPMVAPTYAIVSNACSADIGIANYANDAGPQVQQQEKVSNHVPFVQLQEEVKQVPLVPPLSDASTQTPTRFGVWDGTRSISRKPIILLASSSRTKACRWRSRLRKFVQSGVRNSAKAGLDWLDWIGLEWRGWAWIGLGRIGLDRVG